MQNKNIVENIKNLKNVLIDVSKWKEYLISDIFNIEIAKSIDKTLLVEDIGGINYITRKSTNNGLEYKVKKIDELINNGNCLTISMVGANKGSCFYQKNEFMSSQNMLILRNDKLTKNIGIFLINVFEKKYKVSSDYNAINKNDVLKNNILLPSLFNVITNKYEPDWNYMEQYIDDLYNILNVKSIYSILDKLKNIKLEQFNLVSWKTYLICDYFNVECSKYHNPDNYTEGLIPYVARTTFNNGVVKFISEDSEKLYRGNCIIIGAESARAFYQDKPFITGNKIYRIYPKDKKSKMNKNIGLFLATLLNKEGQKYSYSNAWVSDKVKQTVLCLPSKNGEPDWDYMDNYVAMLEQEIFN